MLRASAGARALRAASARLADVAAAQTRSASTNLWDRMRQIVGGEPAGGEATGLFGIDALRRPEDFEAEAQRAVAECEELIKSITSQALPNTETVQRLDKISDVVCKVVDAAELCRHVHSSSQWREASQQVFGTLMHFVFQLNANRELFDAVAPLVRDSKLRGLLDPESRRVAALLTEEFERQGGIHLPEADRAAVVERHARIGDLCTTFVQNTMRPPQTFRVRPRSALRPLPRQYEPLFPPQPPSLAPDEAELVASAPLCSGILQHVQDPQVRRSAYTAMHSVNAGNLPVLHAIARERHALATSLGHTSFADMTAHGSVAGDPEGVLRFLHELSAGLRPAAAADAARVLARKQTMERAFAGAQRNESDPTTLEAWDVEFYRKVLREGDGERAAEASRRARLQARRSAGAGAAGQAAAVSADQDDPDDPDGVAGADAALAAIHWPDYLSLRNVIGGIQTILREGFGVDMAEVRVRDGEGWGLAPGEVRKFVLRHAEEGELGTVFLDLYSRQNKVGGAAQYVVRCGRRIHEFERAAQRSRAGRAAASGAGEQAAQGAEDGAGGPDGATQRSAAEAGIENAGLDAVRRGYQLPIVALVASFPRPEGARSALGLGSGMWDAGVSLSLSQAETLFHEFGHALHSLLSRTSYQHVSGTRTALDFVEVPSHLFETFATDPRVLPRFATHASTGEPVPADAVAAMLAQRRTLQALDLQGQVTHSVFDQAAFSAAPMSVACSFLHPTTGQIVLPTSHEELASAPAAALTGAAAAVPAGIDLSMTPETFNSSVVLRETMRRHCSFPHVPGTAWQGGFAHIVSYGSAYYSYLFARASAASLWEKLFEADPLSRQAGDRYRADVLARGGTEDPGDTLERVLGSRPSAASLLRRLGLHDAPDGERRR
ncbi:hypothetical protein FNF27_03835 [Cafeteria roenbergensis]|uniref:Peptidase M3A/M3B catalytic domain-containing protein n=1 Tax=Cafeteria roenbergensis TaxID=33653 RepID=A0A5A8CI95_CAFRO|nr:hypothetical protein FNF29_03775 [Cafeteria roenbergensis]KAA0174712.1 hypothetical protein FNF27_03835 [Cafeteria roenbergensis]|eukprot:KAA0152548.1 hypothetical protein FNF29_03775 [Cafeteria roenbergensis]